jgi:hypothetical protein
MNVHEIREGVRTGLIWPEVGISGSYDCGKELCDSI